MIIEASNPSLENNERTMLSTPVASGATTLPVKNTTGFANGNKILLGEYGRERSEITTISSVTPSTSLGTAAITQSHNTDDYVYKLKFDQIKFYRSTTGISGTYSSLATVSVDVNNVENKTLYDDVAGLSTYYYKISYYDSVGTVESQLSDPIPGAGYSRNTVSAVLSEVQSEIGDDAMKQVDRNEWFSWFNEVNDDLMLKGKRPYIFQLTTVALDANAGTDIPYPTDLLKFDRLDYSYTIGGYTQTYAVRDISVEEMLSYRFNSNAIANDYLQLIALDDSSHTIQVYPKFATTRSGVISLRYYRKMIEITSDSQVLETPNPRIYKTYLLSRFYRKKSQIDNQWLNLANTYLNDYNAEVMKLQKNQLRDVGSPRSLSFGSQSNGRQNPSGLRRY